MNAWDERNAARLVRRHTKRDAQSFPEIPREQVPPRLPDNKRGTGGERQAPEAAVSAAVAAPTAASLAEESRQPQPTQRPGDRPSVERRQKLRVPDHSESNGIC